MTNVLTSKQELYTSTSNVISTMETALKTKMDEMFGTGKEISQAELLALQYQMQNYSILFNASSTIQKELTDTIKSLISKI